jgi:hypothetical protein
MNGIRAATIRDSQQIKLDQQKLAAMRNAQSKVNER